MAPCVQVTQYQLTQAKELEQRQKEEQVREKELQRKREVSENTYSRLVETQNQNRVEDVVEASGLEEAISVLVVGDDKEDKHPEK